MDTCKGIHSSAIHYNPALARARIPINRRMGQLWYIHTIKPRTAMRRNKIKLRVTAWANLTINMMLERSQHKRTHSQ